MLQIFISGAVTDTTTLLTLFLLTKGEGFKFNDALAPNEDLSSDYHIYTMAWDESRVDFAFDGRVFFSYSLEDTEESDVHRLPVYFLTGCAAGGADYGVAATKTVRRITSIR